ncbi:MAG TPA: glycosyltransferase family 9 protein [Actinomycetota bacterium]|nr:glycosyltransferase family 9 protein [Actinomycetota bacterium]
MRDAAISGRAVAPLADPSVRTVALVRLRVGLGDLLASGPAMRALRSSRPDLHVAVVTWEEMRPVLDRMAASVDELIPFPGYPGIPERPVDRDGVEPFFEAMRARRFDLAVQMYGALPAANEVTERLGARLTGGFYTPGAYRPVDRRLHVAYPEHLHEVHRHLALVRALGATGGSERMQFPVYPADRAEADAALAGQGVRGPYAVVHPGATAASRRWPPERFAAVADHLADRGLGVVITGVRGEEGLVRSVAGAMRAPAVDLCGRTSLGGFAALLDGAAVLVGNESGPAQLAAALGIPSVTLFFAGDPRRWAPLDRRRHAALSASVDCRPCGLLECPIDFRCAHRLSVDEVLAAVGTVLGEQARGDRMDTGGTDLRRVRPAPSGPGAGPLRGSAGSGPRRSGRTPPGRGRSGGR